MYCHDNRQGRAQENNGAGFSKEPCLANVKIYFCPWLLVHSQVLMITGVNSAMWLGAGWNTEHRLRKLMYVCMYINTQIIKTPQLRARSCKCFLLSHQSERLTAIRKICNTEDGAMLAIIHILCALTDWGLDSIDKIKAISFRKLLFKRWCLLLTRISISAMTSFQLEWEKTMVTFIGTLTYVSISMHYNELF